MPATVQTGFTKATVATDRARVDLALPHAASLGELLPELLRLTGAAPAAATRGWALSRFGGRQLDLTASIADLDLHDGELIYLAPRPLRRHPPVFDDATDAIGEAASGPTAAWTARAGRLAGLLLGSALLAAAAAAEALIGGTTPAVAGFAAATALLALGAVLSRAFSDAAAGALLGALGAVHAAAAGYAVLSPHGDRAACLVLAGAVAAAAGAVAVLAVGDFGYVFSAVIAAAAAAMIAGLCVLGHVPATTVAGFAVVAVVLLAPLAPVASLRLAGVPLPTVPGSVAELRAQAEDPVDDSILKRTRAGANYLSALVITGTAIATTAGVVLAAHQGVYGRLLCLAVALAMALRARLHQVPAQRTALLLGGTGSFAALAALSAAAAHGQARAALAIAALAAAGAVALTAGLVVPGRRSSPYWGRALDLAEVLALTAIVPLAVGTAHWYGYFHGLAG